MSSSLTSVRVRENFSTSEESTAKSRGISARVKTPLIIPSSSFTMEGIKEKVLGYIRDLNSTLSFSRI